ncbi:MAG: nuclear transport factor 2 family protein [Novosphingobium sp.]|uniref:nuclear transport factor 2 family protein n=1 Tax=Novosphingobium sp. TaxID=1874826 RepID=UPI0017D68BDB|nr:nuclear transport factor 2 family protein [Novosphingobium sp.]
MLLSHRLTGVLAGVLATVSLVAPAQAQDDAKSQFQARYTELRTAMEAHDSAAVGKILAPDYTMTDMRGQVHPAAEVLERMAKMPAGAGRKGETTVLSATVTGDSASVEQQLSGSMKRAGDDGEEHTMEMQAKSKDTWVKRGDAWLLQTSVQVGVVIKRDGEEFFREGM